MDKRSAWAGERSGCLPMVPGSALELARLLSPAVRLESALIRTFRLELLPGSGPWIESKLWFSPWSRAATRHRSCCIRRSSSTCAQS